jgi:hypothetical protein
MNELWDRLPSDDHLFGLLDDDPDRLTDEEIRFLEYRFSNEYVDDALQAEPRARAIVAEGDSWFDLPLRRDILKCLKKHRHLIVREADHGDRIEEMVYEPEHRSRTLRALGKYRPCIVLLSAGGNDVAGPELGSFLNHKRSGLPFIRERFADYVVNEVLRKAVIDFFDMCRSVVPKAHILFHGYGHPLPDGRPMKYRPLKSYGPWLKPALDDKGYTNLQEGRDLVSQLIVRFNTMLTTLDDPTNRLHYVNLSTILPPDGAARLWNDELHPNGHVFEPLAGVFNERITAILGSGGCD